MSVWTPAVFIGVLFLVTLIYILARPNYSSDILAPVSTPTITPTEPARIMPIESDGYQIVEGSLYKTSIIGCIKRR
jgi:hypothetical protein